MLNFINDENEVERNSINKMKNQFITLESMEI